MIKDIAGHFGRSPMRISQGIIEFERELRQEESLRQLVEELEMRLTEKAKKKCFITIA